MCYQVAYQLLVRNILAKEQEDSSSCANDASSPQCLEAKLFSNWKAAGDDLLRREADVLGARETAEELDGLIHPRSHKKPNFVGKDGEEVSNERAHSEGSDSSTSASKQLQSYSTHEAETVKVERSIVSSVVQMGHTPWGHVTPWAQSLINLQDTMESRMRLRNHSVQWSNVTAWSRSLMALQADMESKMSAFRARHAKHATTTVQVAPTKHEKSLLERIVEFGREMCMDPRRRGRPACAQFEHNNTGISKQSAPSLRANFSKKAGADEFDARIKEMTKNREEWEKAAAQKLHAFGKQLCEDPKRHSYLSCKQFINDVKPAHIQHMTNATEFKSTDGASIYEAHLKELEDARKSWEQSVMHQIDSFGKEICSAPSRQGYSACNAFLKSDNLTRAVRAQPPKLQQPITSDASRLLNWRVVAAWKASTKDAARPYGPLQVQPHEVQKLRWNGKIPKVACISLVPFGRNVASWLKYFVNDFLAQSYEGPKQLLLVYHHKDVEASKLVKMYADGTLIKAAAAHSDEYPSTAAFRYGAWLADADVVARWDFDAWHHPDRLAIQVRALGLTGRPAAMLTNWTVHHGNGENRTESQGSRWDGGLLGETKWMRDHWYPFINEQKDSLDAADNRYVVKVSMPELMVYDAELEGWMQVVHHLRATE